MTQQTNIMTAIRTAPAEISFVSRAYGCIPGLVRFIWISIAVLNASAMSSIPNEIPSISHSTLVIE